MNIRRRKVTEQLRRVCMYGISVEPTTFALGEEEWTGEMDANPSSGRNPFTPTVEEVIVGEPDRIPYTPTLDEAKYGPAALSVQVAKLRTKVVKLEADVEELRADALTHSHVQAHGPYVFEP